MKKVVILLCIFALVFAMAACGNTNTTNNDGEAVADTSWTDIQEKGKVVIGVDDQFPPMGFLDENGDLVGFDIDLAKAVCEELGVEAEFKAINWSAKEAELQSGSIDLIWNGYTITDERKEKVAFTKPYLKNSQVIITKDGYGVASKEDLTSVDVGIQAESSAIDAVNADPLGADITPNLREYETNQMAMMDLDAGNVKAVVMDEVVANYYISKSDQQYTILTEDFGSEEYGVGMRLEDKEFQQKVSEALDQAIADGKAAAVSETWFGSDKVLK